MVAEHLPDERYAGWPGLVYGGLIAMLVDCHSNWTAIAHHSAFLAAARTARITIGR